MLCFYNSKVVAASTEFFKKGSFDQQSSKSSVIKDAKLVSHHLSKSPK